MITKIAWKNIIHKPLNTALCISLLTFGVGIISLLLLMEHQLEQKFSRDLKNIDLVIGAKGSPLQLVLSAIYHLDAPTGNISLAEARKIMDNPMVKEAIPLAYGDSYQGYRILGTTTNYVKKYDAQIKEGKLFSKKMEVTLGADVAQRTGLTVGTTFFGTHGEAQGGHVHDNHAYTIVGILEKTNTVLDNLLLTNIESVWQVHTEHSEAPSSIDTLHATTLDLNHNHDGHDHNHHDHHDESVITADSMDITAILLKYKTKRSILTMPRLINEQTNMQAVLPALEINRLFYMIGVGVSTLKLIAGGIMFMAGFSVFFGLYSRLKERKYELALLRSVGYKRTHLFGLLISEGILLALIGYVLGWALSRLGLHFVNHQAQHDFNLQFDNGLIAGEAGLLLVTFGVGILAALIPALQAMRMNVSAILSEN
ncbi:MAG: putative ABC transport system permease protein [Salibacteraceae bacterium]|jgi:putative ABC transport system permease protein